MKLSSVIRLLRKYNCCQIGRLSKYNSQCSTELTVFILDQLTLYCTMCGANKENIFSLLCIKTSKERNIIEVDN